MNKDFLQELTENSELLRMLEPVLEQAKGYEDKSSAALIIGLSYALMQRKVQKLCQLTGYFVEQCYLETLCKYPQDIPADKELVEVGIGEGEEVARVKVGEMELIVKVKGRVRQLVDKERQPKLRLIRGGK